VSDFVEFPKMARLSRECIVTEKIDGTNGCILIDDAGMLIGSRSRWITPSDDNFGFARWCHEHFDELMQLGPGRHFGEWWGAGIQRKYNQTEKRFSLFNALRWVPAGTDPQQIPSADPRIVKMQQAAPACCAVVPVLARGVFTTNLVDWALDTLRHAGSVAAPGFMNPEGIVVFHVAGGVGFKKTLDRDGEPKGQSR